jgi:hypothetical protein
MIRFLGPLLFVAVTVTAAHAAPPSPIASSLFGFPGQTLAPGSGRTAALAGANRWLGDEPFHNPAVAADGVVLTPVLQRVSRQDLRSDNRQYDETSVFFDVLGGWAARSMGAWSGAIYAHQSLLRHENFAFTRGPNIVPPGTVAGQADVREYRAGLAVSRSSGPWRFGLAGEWSGRDDTYETNETSGSPSSGFSHADFSGSAIGFQGGARWDGAAPWGAALAVGAGARFVPSLELEGTQQLNLLTGDSTAAIRATRESGWEGGLSSRLAIGPTFDAMASLGGRTAQTWDGFGVTDGALFEWRIGGEFHAPEEPWTFRFGLGQEHQTDVAESRTGVLGLGLGWDFDGVVIDVGAIRRTLRRDTQPTSYEDRFVGSVVIAF